MIVFLIGIAAVTVYRYGEHSWRFRIESSNDIEIIGIHNVTHSQVMEVVGGDLGRNIFFIPLAERKAQLQQIPWVESASVMRFVPNRLKVEIQERTPVAFARIGPRISLTDAGGTLMELPPAGKKKYSFPVILGMNSGEPLSTRGARMRIYNELIRQLDSGGGRYSQDLSEVDLSDPEDVKVSVSDPSGEVLVHLGSSNFLDRYKIYVGHVREWRKQFDKLESVDLRYERQIIVNPDLRGAVKQPPLSVAAAKAAVAAGVKPAALISHEVVSKKTSVRSPATKPLAQPTIKPVARNKRKWARTKHWKRVARRGRGLAPKAASQAAPAALPSAASVGTAATTNPISNATPAPAKPPSHSLRKKPSPAIAKDQEDP